MAKAKGKKSSDKTSKSNKGTGAKLAKSVQKSGLMDLINSNLGREILADALIAAAGAAAAALTKTRTAQKAGAAAVDAGSKATDATTDLVQTASGAVANVVTEAARQFLPASLLGEEEDQGKDKGRAIPRGKKVQYAHLSSDHSKRKTSRKPKDDKAEKH